MSALTLWEQAVRLFAGIGVTLLVASAIGCALKAAVAQGRPHDVIDNLNARIRSWWMIVSAVGAAFLLGREGMVLLFVFASFAALREFTAPIASRGEGRLLAVSFGVVLPVQYLLVWLGWFNCYSVFVPVCAFVLIPMVAAGAGSARRSMTTREMVDQPFATVRSPLHPGEGLGVRDRACGRIRERSIAGRGATIQWGLVICVFCISHVPAILTLDIADYEGRNLLLIVFLMVVVQSSDVLQYVWGKLCGRRKVAPAISASKTWEGLIGGVASATALGAALYWLTPFTPLAAALMALAANIMGVLGGFAMSAIKRTRGIKDWGSLIAGHGGMLDRLDSMVLAAPVFFHLTRAGWAV